MAKILLICHDIPSMTVGATLPFYHLIKQLGTKHEISLVSFDSEKYSINDLKDYLKDYVSLKIPEYLDLPNQLKYTVKNMFSFENIHTRSLLNYYYHPRMNRLIQDKITNDLDIIITDMPMAFYAKKINVPKIVYAFDAVSDYNHKMYLKSDNVSSKIYWYLNYLKIHRYEKIYNYFDYCILVNNKDKEILEEDITIPLKVIPNGVDTHYFSNKNSNGEVKLVFLGDMSTPPNNDAVKYFIDKIYPKILEEKFIKFYIVGRNPSNYIKSLHDNDNIIVTGSVEDVRVYLDKNTIFITPMISGTGIKNKILEAMSMKLAVVSTSIGISGIKAENNVNYLLADSEEEFKENILRLIDNEKLRDTLGDNARSLVENKYSWENSMDILEKLIIELIS